MIAVPSFPYQTIITFWSRFRTFVTRWRQRHLMDWRLIFNVSKYSLSKSIGVSLVWDDRYKYKSQVTSSQTNQLKDPIPKICWQMFFYTAAIPYSCSLTRWLLHFQRRFFIAFIHFVFCCGSWFLPWFIKIGLENREFILTYLKELITCSFFIPEYTQFWIGTFQKCPFWLRLVFPCS